MSTSVPVDRRATARAWLALVALLAGLTLGCGAEEVGVERDESELALSRDGSLAFASRGAVYVARGGSPAARISEPGDDIDGSPDWSPDGSRLVFARSSEDGAQGIYVARRNGGGLRRLTRGHDGEPAWSPDGDTIVFEHARGPFALASSIRAIDADGNASATSSATRRALSGLRTARGSRSSRAGAPPLRSST